jgi:Helicase conserved C-terminal domain
VVGRRLVSGASNIPELNLLMKEVMLRRTKEEVLDLPPKLRSWIPLDVSSKPAVLSAIQSFLSWYEQTDPAAPNDRQFLARLTKVRTRLHAAKHDAVAERMRDIVACGEKVVVFTCYQTGIERHKKAWDEAAVTITGADSVEARQAAVDRFQDDPQVKVALCNIIAGGVGITLTAARHVLFQDLDWVPANRAQAEDRCYRLGQTRTVTVEYFHAANSLDGYIAELLSRKMALIAAVESDEVPDASIVDELQAGLRALTPAMHEEVRLAKTGAAPKASIEALIRKLGPQKQETEIERSGSWEFTSSRNVHETYRVTFGRAGHLECTCKGFEYRGELAREPIQAAVADRRLNREPDPQRLKKGSRSFGIGAVTRPSWTGSSTAKRFYRSCGRSTHRFTSKAWLNSRLFNASSSASQGTSTGRARLKKYSTAASSFKMLLLLQQYERRASRLGFVAEPRRSLGRVADDYLKYASGD